MSRYFGAQDRAALVASARQDVLDILTEHHLEGPPEFNCVPFAVALVRRLQAARVPALFQAGTAMWPRLTPDQDDGYPSTCTHFSHMFNMAEARPRLFHGLLPELHCWAVIPDRRRPARSELIDGTTGSWPDKCRLQTGKDWPGEQPPAFLWARICQLPPGVVYHPDETAIRIALAFHRAVTTGQPLVLSLR